MPVLADDDVVVHGNAGRGGDVDDRLGHLDVSLRWRRIAGGMVVQENAVCKIALMSFIFFDAAGRQGTWIGG
jgi:hypothetical protein